MRFAQKLLKIILKLSRSNLELELLAAVIDTGIQKLEKRTDESSR